MEGLFACVCSCSMIIVNGRSAPYTLNQLCVLDSLLHWHYIDTTFAFAVDILHTLIG